MAECNTAVAQIDLTKVKPYGDTLNDGMTEVAFTLPVPYGDEANEAAKILAKKMGLDEPNVVYAKEMTKEYTFFVVYGKCQHTVDYTTIKVAKVEELLNAQQATKQQLAFVGDGINDAPVLSRADIGIAMGALGSDAAIEAADVVLMDDDPLKIAKAIRISRKCMRIVHENIWFAIGIKVLCLLLCAVGLVGMWAAIFADVGVMVLAVLNAIRTLFV